MMVPPGVGRRKRDNNDFNIYDKTMLTANNSHLTLTHGNDLLHQMPYPSLNSEFLEEIPLGIVVTMQAWHLSSISLDKKTQTKCTERNFCELGQNCAVFGPGSLFACQFGADTMARWLASESSQEVDYLKSFKYGVNLESCETHNALCPVHHWNNFIAEAKEYTNEFM